MEKRIGMIQASRKGKRCIPIMREKTKMMMGKETYCTTITWSIAI